MFGELSQDQCRRRMRARRVELITDEEIRVRDNKNVFRMPSSKRKTKNESKGARPKKMRLKEKQISKTVTQMYSLTLTVN